MRNREPIGNGWPKMRKSKTSIPTREQVWEEGYNAGYRDHAAGRLHRETNPYSPPASAEQSEVGPAENKGETSGPNASHCKGVQDDTSTHNKRKAPAVLFEGERRVSLHSQTLGVIHVTSEKILPHNGDLVHVVITAIDSSIEGQEK